MRNAFHIIIGFTASYVIFELFKFNEFPLSWEYLNNFLTPLIGGFLVSIPAFFWEKRQEQKFNARFDVNDIYRSALGGVLGGATSMISFSWKLAIPLIILSIYLVIFKTNK